MPRAGVGAYHAISVSIGIDDIGAIYMRRGGGGLPTCRQDIEITHE